MEFFSSLLYEKIEPFLGEKERGNCPGLVAGL